MQLSLFPRAASGEQIQQTIDSFNAYAKDYHHWQISFSGGKDSTTLVTLTLDLIERGLIPRPKTLTVMYADTRMELPPLHASAMGILEEVRRRGWDAQVLTYSPLVYGGEYVKKPLQFSFYLSPYHIARVRIRTP